ncbi:beta-N-acetylhexosaminidase [Plantactinospora sp. GCM10030261]|uniref:beta-N-acetylhexosaminidase n=1 Tax=Plantactinospora sp. GCM10030261 TaxID=3273420 RepID=UPI0036149BA0
MCICVATQRSRADRPRLAGSANIRSSDTLERLQSQPRAAIPGSPLIMSVGPRSTDPSTTTPPPRATPDREAMARLDALLPRPLRVEQLAGAAYRLTPETTIRATAQPDALDVAEHLADLLRGPTGYPLPVTPAGVATADGDITLLLTDDAAEPESAGAEGYQLDVTADAVTLRGRTATGLHHGVQTLRQLLPPAVDGRTAPGPWTVPGCRIADHPRYAYRGVMLDVARHFFDADQVCRFIDQVARYKINYLHLHLTDDQGWRIAIDSWPRLTEVGGASQVGGGPGGYYTKADYQRIVGHAARRRITVVPEIDVPGHTNAALVAYPELAPGGRAPVAYTGTDVGFSALDVTNGRTYTFLTDVLGEVAELSPGQFLHLGGDEAFTLPPGAYTDFVNRAQAIVAATGKRVLGWHQTAPATHVDGRVLHYWGTTAEQAPVADAVRRGAGVLLSPADRCYLDMKYTADTPIGHDWAGHIETRRAYDWDPASYLDGVPAEAILGIEAPLWTESVTTPTEIEFMVFPRLPAIAELGWSPAAGRDWSNFRARLAAQATRWRAAGIAFHHSPEVPWPAPRTAAGVEPTSTPAAPSAGTMAAAGPPVPTPRDPADDAPVG